MVLDVLKIKSVTQISERFARYEVLFHPSLDGDATSIVVVFASSPSQARVAAKTRIDALRKISIEHAEHRHDQTLAALVAVAYVAAFEEYIRDLYPYSREEMLREVLATAKGLKAHASVLRELSAAYLACKITKEFLTMKLVLEIDDKKLHDMLLSAGGWCHYWCSTDKAMTCALEKNGVAVGLKEPLEIPPYRQYFILNRDKLRIGLMYCARDNPRIFAQFLAGQCDGLASDVIVQYALFGKVQFG